MRWRLTAVLFLFVVVPYAWGQTEHSLPVSAGGEIHYYEMGTANGRPAIVFIPGWRLTASLWQDEMQRFSKERRVIAIDPRSQAGSKVTTEGNTAEQRARDLHELIGKLHLDKPAIVGWSQGSQDVAAYVLQFGDAEVSAFVLVDSPVAGGPEDMKQYPAQSQQFARLMGIYTEHPEEYTREMMKRITKHPVSAEMYERMVREALKTPADIGAAMFLNDLLEVDRRTALTKITRPTLVLAASDSPMQEQQRAMAKQIKLGKFEVMPDSGHGIFLDHPEQFFQVVDEFLK